MWNWNKYGVFCMEVEVVFLFCPVKIGKHFHLSSSIFNQLSVVSVWLVTCHDYQTLEDENMKLFLNWLLIIGINTEKQYGPNLTTGEPDVLCSLLEICAYISIDNRSVLVKIHYRSSLLIRLLWFSLKWHIDGLGDLGGEIKLWVFLWVLHFHFQSNLWQSGLMTVRFTVQQMQNKLYHIR